MYGVEKVALNFLSESGTRREGGANRIYLPILQLITPVACCTLLITFGPHTNTPPTELSTKETYLQSRTTGTRIFMSSFPRSTIFLYRHQKQNDRQTKMTQALATRITPCTNRHVVYHDVAACLVRSTESHRGEASKDKKAREHVELSWGYNLAGNFSGANETPTEAFQPQDRR